MYDIDILPGLIELGHLNEKGVCEIEFDVTDWLADYPLGVLSITYIRPGETTVYPVEVTGASIAAPTSGSLALTLADAVYTLTWTVSDAVTAIAGSGSIVITLTEGDTIVKRSDKVQTIVMDGHAAAGDPPEPLADYIEKWGAVDVEVTEKPADDELTQSVTQDSTGTHFDLQIHKGNGIASVLRTAGNGAAGTTDTYTITYDDATITTFDVVNGAIPTAADMAIDDAGAYYTTDTVEAALQTVGAGMQTITETLHSVINVDIAFPILGEETDDSARIQRALDSVETNPKTLFFPAKTYDLGTVGIGFNFQKVHIMGEPGTIFDYSGTGAAIWCQHATGGVGSEGFIIDEITILGGGAEGIRLGRTATISPAVGTIKNVNISGMDVGINCVSAQICNFVNVKVTECGTGLLMLPSGGYFNTDCKFTDCRFNANTNEGAVINGVWLAAFSGCQFEGNGKEGVKIWATGTLAVHQVVFEQCWIEANNDGRTGGYYQLLIVGVTSNIDFIAVENCNFAVSGTDNKEIGIFGDATPVFLRNNRYVTDVGASTTHGTIAQPNENKIFVEGIENKDYWYFGKWKAFTSGGTTAIAVGDTITGSVSGATATVLEITVSSGSWAGGNAAGTLYIAPLFGTFQSENLLVGGTDLATISAKFNETVISWAINDIHYAQSHEIDFSNVAETFVIFAAKRAGKILKLWTVYTETSGSGLGATAFKVGTHADDDKFFAGTLTSLNPQWTVSNKTLLVEAFAAGDIITAISANGVAVEGKMIVCLEYIYD